MRTDVAMHDMQRGPAHVERLVRRMQPRKGIAHDARHDSGRQKLTGRVRGRKELRQGQGLDVLEDEEKLPAGLGYVDHRDDVGVAYERRDPGLVEKHVAKLWLPRRCGCTRLTATSRSKPPAPA